MVGESEGAGESRSRAAGELTLGLMSGEERGGARCFFVGASLLAINDRATRAFRQPASSLTSIVGTPPGAGSLLQGAWR